jgi:starch-binding outer membrane protein, SusD/RagB family
LVSFTDGTQIERLKAARDAAKLIIDGTYGIYFLTGTITDPPSPLTAANVKTYTDNFFNLFNQKGTWNNESIWGVQFNDQASAGHKLNQECGPNGWHGWGNSSPIEESVREFEMADGTPFIWDVYNPGNTFLRTATAAQLATDPLRNPYNGREPRFYATILYHGAYFQPRPTDMAALDPTGQVQSGNFYKADGTLIKFGLDTRQTLVEGQNGTKTGYYLKKFLDPSIEGQYYYNSNALIDMRYSEVLLNYAETCIELGGADLQPGLDALNMVRNRAGLPDRVGTDQATAREWVRKEKDIEFYAELEHWYDIRRWMTAGTVLKNVRAMNIKQFDNGNMEWKWDNVTNQDTRIFDPKNIWLPINRDEMNKAPQLQQNPGYN